MIKWFLAPLMGAVIGYITNDLAIRMLFRPRRALYIGEFHVPFTPGVIPAQKGRIARSIGSVISTQLLNEETLRRTLLSEDAILKLQDAVRRAIHSLSEEQRTIKELLEARYDEQTLITTIGDAEIKLSGIISDKIKAANIGNLIVDNVTAHLLEAISQNRVLDLLLDTNTRETLKGRLAAKLNEIIAEEAPTAVLSIVDNTRAELMGMRICDIYARYQDREEALIRRGTDLYVSILGSNLEKLLRALNIEKIVVDKIDAFDAAELESMIFEVMKKELNAIVYLGAGLGFLMGFVNLLW
ncbi:MAG: DUF445 family protein [Clostridia bacterium]|nr:DUF445 family protein [Clostridia bacterium]